MAAPVCEPSVVPESAEWRWGILGFLQSWGLEAPSSLHIPLKKAFILSTGEAFCNSFKYLGYDELLETLIVCWNCHGHVYTVHTKFLQNHNDRLMGKAFQHFLACKYQTTISLACIVSRCLISKDLLRVAD